MGSLTLSPALLGKSIKHQIKKSSLEYHNPNIFCMVEDICLGKRQSPVIGFKITITANHGQFKVINQVICRLVAERCFQWVEGHHLLGVFQV